MDKTLKKRNDFLQAARGIAIIVVILIHCKNGIDFKNSVFPLNYNYFFWIFERQFLNFAVGLFFFLSAFFVNKDEVRQNPVKWIKKRVVRIGIPYLIFSCIYVIIKIFQRYNSIQLSFFVKQLIAVLTGNAWFHLYFVFVLFQLIIITPLLLKYKASNYVLLIFNLSLLALRYFYNPPVIDNNAKCFFLYWFIFYIYGIFYQSISKSIKKHPFFLLTFAILFNAFEVQVLLLKNFSDSFIAGQLKISSVIYALSIINLIMYFNEKDENYFKPNKIERTVINIGNLSFGMYLIHPIYVLIFNYCVKNSYIIAQGGAITQIIELFIVCSLSFGSCCLFKKMLGSQKAKILFGV